MTVDAVAMVPPVVPTRRQNMTDEQRLQICAHRAANPKMTQQQLARWAKETFAMPVEPSQSAISTILRRMGDGGAAAVVPRKLKKKRRVKYPKLDDALLKWVLDCDQHEIRISGELVKQKADALCEKFKISKDARPHFSNGWLASFNRRHGLKRYKRNPDLYDDDDDDEEDGDEEGEAKGDGSAATKSNRTKKKPRFSISKEVNGETRRVELENNNGSSGAQPWNELTEEELAARKREADLRIEGLRYDNSLKRLKVIEENMLARKRLKDAGVSEEEIDQLMPLARAANESEL
ncbi:putative Ars binding protein 1 [Globisporangium polare]